VHKSNKPQLPQRGHPPLPRLLLEAILVQLLLPPLVVTSP